MQITIKKEIYKGGGDGSSLSYTRCYQIVQVYDMLEQLGDTYISYVGIQQRAKDRNLFGETSADSAIRTIFPLLKKIGFVKYDEEFMASECFTKLGKAFALTCRAYNNALATATLNKDIVTKLLELKKNIQKQGLLVMYQNPECSNHNIWVALKLLKELDTIHWNYFIYALYLMDEGKNINETIEKIKLKSKEIKEAIFKNEKNNELANTIYSYVRAFLEECGLISSTSSKSKESTLTKDGYEFLSMTDL